MNRLRQFWSNLRSSFWFVPALIVSASIGIPKDSILQYESNLKAGKFLLILHATPDEVERAKDCLGESQAVETTVHAEPAEMGV